VANVGLATVEQPDFSAGSFQGTQRALIPPNGFYKAVNWLTDDDGSLYRRGGTEAHSNTAFGASGRFVHDDVLSVGQRTIFASPSAFAALDADDQTPRSLGGAGMAAPGRANELMGFLFIDGAGAIYAGSRKTADYSVGTITTVQNSAVITGSGTLWSANVDAGMLLRIGGAGRYWIVKSVDSNTQITLTEAYTPAGAAGLSYALTRLGTTSVSPYRGSLFSVVANRLLSIEANQLFFSGVRNPHSFAATDFHQLPGGSTGLGGARAGDKFLWFTSGGIWVVSNMALELTDAAGNPQQRLEQTSQDIVLWGNAGVETWQGAVVVPALDGVWLVSALGQPLALLSRSITAQYRAYVKAGYQPGQAEVWRSHYVLPIVDGSNVVQDELVCRLDRPQEARGGTVYPWTFMDDTGGRLYAFAARSSSRPPRLLAVSSKADARVVNADTWWNPDAAHKSDHDGTTHHVDVIGRDTEPGGLATFRQAQARYEGADAGTDNPTLQGYYSVGVQTAGGAVWGAASYGVDAWTDSVGAEFIQFSSSGVKSDGRDPQGWSFVAHARFIRWRLLSSAPWATLTLRSFKWRFRQTPKG
jgi:hypothetical protein